MEKNAFMAWLRAVMLSAFALTACGGDPAATPTTCRQALQLNSREVVGAFEHLTYTAVVNPTCKAVLTEQAGVTLGLSGTVNTVPSPGRLNTLRLGVGTTRTIELSPEDGSLAGGRLTLERAYPQFPRSQFTVPWEPAELPPRFTALVVVPAGPNDLPTDIILDFRTTE